MKNENMHPYLNFRISYLRQFFRFVLFLIAIFSVFYALAWDNSYSMRTLWVLDTSLSMVTQDIGGSADKVYISRLDAAKMIMASGVTLSSRENALISFDDTVRLVLPFSSDVDTFHAVTNSLDTKIYGGATDITAALSGILLIYPREVFHIVLLTDGENSGTGESYPEFPTNMQFSIVGIGTTKGGPMLQGYDALGKPRYKQYQGTDAISRLDEKYLRGMAEEYHGEYFQVSDTDAIGDVVAAIQKEQYQALENPSRYFLSAGIFLFLLALIMKPYKQES